jgi:hypothetical protein
MDFKKDNENIYYGDYILGKNKTRILEFNDEDIIVSKPSFSNLIIDLSVDNLPQKVEFIFETLENYSIITKNVGILSPFEMDFHFMQYYWDFKIDLGEYILILTEKLQSYDLFKEVRPSIADKGFDIKLLVNINHNMIIRDRVHEVKSIFDKCNNELLSNYEIRKTIEFRKEHLSAGMSILQYFGKILQEKYPNEEVSVSIKQEGLKVTMLIDTSDGKKEEIEEYLNRYGMVVTNQIRPQEFTSSPIQILKLERKLAQAQQEIGFQKKLLALQDKTYDETLVSLKDEVKYLRGELSALRISNNDNLQLLLSSLLSKDKLIKKLTNSIEKRDEKETQELLLELKEKDLKGYVSLKEHIDNIIVGNLTNTPAWMEFLITHFSK